MNVYNFIVAAITNWITEPSTLGNSVFTFKNILLFLIIVSGPFIISDFLYKALDNNLVSGLIITFEKPISVGDMIEVGTDKGWVKGIGIHSINIHTLAGAEYATEEFIKKKKNGRLGRSFGCPAVPPNLIKQVIETIKDGTCLFIYQKDENYIHHSSVLN